MRTPHVAIVALLLLAASALVILSSSVVEKPERNPAPRPPAQEPRRTGEGERHREHGVVLPRDDGAFGERERARVDNAPSEDAASQPEVGVSPSEVSPQTPEQREAFIREVMLPRGSDIASICYSDLAEKHAARIRDDLSPADRRAAESALGVLLDAEFRYRTHMHERVIDYIRTATDLSTYSRTAGQRGRSGVVTFGLDGTPSVWNRAGAGAVVVRYFLPFDQLPTLAEARQAVTAATAVFERYTTTK